MPVVIFDSFFEVFGKTSVITFIFLGLEDIHVVHGYLLSQEPCFANCYAEATQFKKASQDTTSLKLKIAVKRFLAVLCTSKLRALARSEVVEMGGIEPPSEVFTKECLPE